MKCERCRDGKEARYRVYSDAMDLKVCSNCAAVAANLRLTIELLPHDELRNGAASEATQAAKAACSF